MPELIIIAVIFVLLFGAKKLPEIAAALGKAMKEFKSAGKEANDSVNKAVENKDESKTT